MLIRGAQIGEKIMDVRITDGRVLSIEGDLEARTDEVIVEAAGGMLIPGLRDHHLHLQSLAASLDSVACGPPTTTDAEQFIAALRDAIPRDGWIRGAGYFESAAGELDRAKLDRIRSDVPIRIQHRSGVLWFFNSAALEAIDADGQPTDSPGLERDAAGRATGRGFRMDEWLRSRLPASPAPDLARVGTLLSEFGVTAVTDCTPTNTGSDRDRFAEAQAAGSLPQRIEWMGELGLREWSTKTTDSDHLFLGAHKIMLDEPSLPDFDALVSRIRAAHDEGRATAFHTVTRTEIYFALAALEAAGSIQGDRLEHASVAPPEAMDAIKRLGIAIATQPNFVAERGDDYLDEVEPKDQPHLYRVRGWLEAGVPLAGGTDAPFGNPDPWRAMRAAVERRTLRGRVLGADERVSPEAALRLFSAAPFPAETNDHGSAAEDAPPEIGIGQVADLCLLDAPWSQVRTDLASHHVVATWIGGECVYQRNTRS